MYSAMRSCCHIVLRLITKFRLKYVGVGICLFMLLDFFGAFTHMFEISYNEHFVYPYEGEVHDFVMALKHKEKPAVNPINEYNYSFIIDSKQKCREPGYSTFRIVYVVKSAIENEHRRAAIRNSWGFEKRFFDVPSRTVFVLGIHPEDEELQSKVKAEATKHNDIIQADFIDSYYNNTIKTMMGFKWLTQYCSNSKFYMFVDDDMYVSVKNVLRFIRNPTNYPDYLKEPKKLGAHKREVKQSDNPYRTNVDAEKATVRLNSSTYNATSIVPVIYSTRPIATVSKVSDSESSQQNNIIDNNVAVNFKYKLTNVDMRSATNSTRQSDTYDNKASVLIRKKRQIFDFELPEDVRLFAGFVFVSSPHRHKSSKWFVSLEEYPYDLWPPYITAGAYILSKEAFVDMYYTSLYTQHFRFDDIFLALVAKKAGVEPFHCEEFRFYKEYTKYNFKYVITSHGYGDPNELLYVWNEQKALGNA